jgi:hypothetical protein
MLNHVVRRVVAIAAGLGAFQAQTMPSVARPWLVVQDQRTAPIRPRVELNTLRDIHLVMELCWRANLPPTPEAVPGMTITLRVSFTRSGEVLGAPSFTFVTQGVSPQTRNLYQRAAANALNSCTPLPFSPGLGDAVAGQPRVFLFIDRRNEKRA